ncbi:MAG: hypothetical protein JWM82_4369, partial [Myxococcales bacterium]|nr:hypothetical protein [Myxococcales bacterium]
SAVIVGATKGKILLIHIAASSNHSCATKTDKTITCWGASVGAPPSGPFAQLTTGRDFTCGLTAGGAVSCAGTTNASGQLDAPNGMFVQIAAGFAHACARPLTGAITCWGDNQFGQRAPPSSFYSDVSAGGNRRCLVDFDGHVECVGEKILGTDRPASLISSVAVGPTVSCGIARTGGALECWDGSGHQLGPLGGSFAHVAVGGDQVCGVTTANELKCWDLTGTPRVDTPSGLFWEVAVGDSHACAVLMSGVAVCWGNNASLQSTPP